MTDPRITKLADTLIHYCTSIKAGDWVWVRGHVLALPLVQEVVRAATLAGGNPMVTLFSEELDEAFLSTANDDQLNWVAPIDEMIAEKVDARIVIGAAHNTRALNGIEPRKQQLFQKAHRKMAQTFMQRAAAGTHRWVGTQFHVPPMPRTRI